MFEGIICIQDNSNTVAIEYDAFRDEPIEGYFTTSIYFETNNEKTFVSISTFNYSALSADEEDVVMVITVNRYE